ncbi:MAG: nitroreductase family protein [Acidimicrobiia bacterium]
MSDTYDFILKLRAIRQYTDEPVSKKDLEKILEAARWTGSSKNTQRWAFLVYTDRGQLDRLAECGSFTDPLRNATAAIVLVQEPEGYEFDIGRVAQNIMLAAKAIGVASCPITLHKQDVVGAVVDLEEGQVARYAVALGYPADDAAPAKFGGRKDSQRLVRWI